MSIDQMLNDGCQGNPVQWIARMIGGRWHDGRDNIEAQWGRQSGSGPQLANRSAGPCSGALVGRQHCLAQSPGVHEELSSN